MNPNNKKNQVKKKLTFYEQERQRNYFEYRFDEDNICHFLFNPITGEKLPHTDYDVVDRAKSLWCTPTKPNLRAPKDRDAHVYSVILCSVPYQSRVFGACVYRRFRGWKTKILAANHIVTVSKGFLSRQLVRRMICKRFYKVLDTPTQLYYFQDNFDNSKETSWYKPRLAYGDNIFTNTFLNSEYVIPSKYSYQNVLQGPYYKLSSCGKANKTRAVNHAFIPKNEVNESPVISHSEIDLDKSAIGSIISWIDGSTTVNMVMTEYEYIRTAESTNDWSRVIKYMTQDTSNSFLQIYGFFSFSKSFVPVDNSGLLHPVRLT